MTEGTAGARSEGGRAAAEDDTNPQALSKDEQQAVDKMKARDREVRAHEMAHVSAGGAHVTSGPTYSFQTGPDGRRYAVGGEVGIDTSPEDDPQATIAKMAQVRAAALAPAEPSGADRAVAAAAAQESAKARAEMTSESTETSESTGSTDSTAQNGSAHSHPGGGACPGCVGGRYGGESQATGASVVDLRG